MLCLDAPVQNVWQPPVHVVWQVPKQEALHPLHEVEQLPVHREAQAVEQLPHPEDVEVLLQLALQSEQPSPPEFDPVAVPVQLEAQALEQPWLQAEVPQPFIELPTHDWMQLFPQLACAVPIHELLHPISSSLSQDEKIAVGIARPTKIGITLCALLLKNLRRVIRFLMCFKYLFSLISQLLNVFEPDIF